MNETITTIYQRRAVRKYLPNAVDQSIVEEILNAGRMAPSAINIQPWKFYILNDTDDIIKVSKAIKTEGLVKGMLKAGISQLIKTAIHALHFASSADFAEAESIFHRAPVVIFVAAPKDSEWAALDIGMCCQNMMLAAKSLGLDTCPVGFAKYIQYTKVYKRLGIPKSEKVRLAIVLGYGNEKATIHPRIRNNVTWVNLTKNTNKKVITEQVLAES